MSIPHDRIRRHANLTGMQYATRPAHPVLPLIDHCHVHGATRGASCPSRNGRIVRVDADPSIATPVELFHRDNCPGCPAEGFDGVSHLLIRPSGPVTSRVTGTTSHLPPTRV